MTPAEERLGWLDCLINSYERVRRLDPHAKEDPEAAFEMLRECKELTAELRANLPRAAAALLTDAQMDALRARAQDPEIPF
jgi:hypothetical protein